MIRSWNQLFMELHLLEQLQFDFEDKSEA
jgi:hypothetical protein